VIQEETMPFTFSASGSPSQVLTAIKAATQLPSWLKAAYNKMVENAELVGSVTCAISATETSGAGDDAGTTLVTTFNQGYYEITQ
jgi:hypothetical protein